MFVCFFFFFSRSDSHLGTRYANESINGWYYLGKLGVRSFSLSLYSSPFLSFRICVFRFAFCVLVFAFWFRVLSFAFWFLRFDSCVLVLDTLHLVVGLPTYLFLAFSFFNFFSIFFHISLM